MEYGCIGEHLTHSFSKEIHAQLQNYLYELKELPLGTLNDFMTKRNFKAINVTIPYKQEVIPFLKETEEKAAAIGAVNTVVNRNGELYGYNTDFGGMADLIKRTGIDLKGRKVLIFGTGGTSKTAKAVAEDMGAACVWKVSRSEGPNLLTYNQVTDGHLDAQVLINTTPKGMFSRESGMPLDPALFPQLEGVIDAVYNPLRTEFVLKARDMGVPAAGGLYMLVRQAVLASEIFLNTKYPDAITEEVYKKIKSQKENVILTGMPGSGKTTVGKLLAKSLNRPFIDTDIMIEEDTGMTPADIISSKGEAAFREIESQIIRKAAQKNGCIIATGGGAVLRADNIRHLRSNGKLFFLNRPIEQLIPTENRPLSSTKEAVLKRYNERYATYLSTADVIIENNTTPEAAVEKIEMEFFK